MHNRNLIKANPASGETEITKHLRMIAEEMSKETRTASEAQDAIKAQCNYTVEFRKPYVSRTDFNYCKEILGKMQNRQELTRTERRNWDRLVVTRRLAPGEPITEVRQTGQNKEN